MKNEKEKLTLFPQSFVLPWSFTGPSTLRYGLEMYSKEYKKGFTWIWLRYGLNMYSEEYKKGFTWRKSLPQPSALSRSKLGRERLNVPFRLLILQLGDQMGLVASIIRMVYHYPTSFPHLHVAPLG